MWSLDQPRLTTGSIGIEAGDDVSLVFGSLFTGIPLLDADGLRRFKQTHADIGAYEFGDFNWLESNIFAELYYDFPLSNPNTDGNQDAKLFIAQNWNPGGVGGVYNNHVEGVRYGVSYFWAIFNEDGANMPQNAAFNVFLPATGSGVFLHKATGANSLDDATQMDDPSVNNQPDNILIVTQNYNPPASGGIVNHNPIAADYVAGGDNHWYLRNLGGSVLPHAAFNIYSQAPSPNAFVHVSSAANINYNWTVIDHPLLNDTPCAQVMFSQRSLSNPHIAGVWYTGTRWAIFNEDGAAMPVNAQFSVLVNPAQIVECTDVIFANGFD